MNAAAVQQTNFPSHDRLSEVQKYSSSSHVAESVDAEPSSPEDLFFWAEIENGWFWFERAAKFISVWQFSRSSDLIAFELKYNWRGDITICKVSIGCRARVVMVLVE